MIKAVIFDIDGIMIDSEPIHSKAFEAILREYGHEPEFNEYGNVHTTGLKSKANWEILKQKHKIDEDIDILVEKKREYYGKIAKNELKPLAGLISLIKLLKSKGLKLAVASNSNLKMIKIILEKLGIENDFDLIMSGDFVGKAKPHPEIYAKTAKELNIDPKECVAFEDSEAGVESAFGAGMKVIAVPTEVTRNDNFSNASLIVSSLEDINWDILEKL